MNFLNTFPVNGRVGCHDGALTGPEEPCADSKEGTSDDGKGLVVVMVVIEEAAGVENVGGAASKEGEAGAEDVVDPAAEDPKDSEGGVEGGVRIVCRGGIHLLRIQKYYLAHTNLKHNKNTVSLSHRDFPSLQTI